MTAITRAITAKKNKSLTFANQVAYPDSGAFYLCSDRTTFIGLNPANKLQLRYSTNYGTNPATATWTAVTTFPSVIGTPVIDGVVELSDGELLVYVNQTTNSAKTGRIFRSTGWTTNRASVTFAEVLVSVGGTFQAVYNSHPFVAGSDGIVLAAEAGPQTTSANLATGLAAIRSWISKDFGATWRPLLNLVDYSASQGFPAPLGMHWHGVGYDEQWGRIWLLYGDNMGDGKNVAGLNNTQVIYSDDLGVTWYKLPQPDYFTTISLQSNSVHQYIGVAFSAEAIVFTPDVSVPLAPIVFPRVGYRKLGAPVTGPFMRSATSFVMSHCALYNKQGKRNNEPSRPLFVFSGAKFGASASGREYGAEVLISHDLMEWSSNMLQYDYTNQTASGFYCAMGPTLEGKMFFVCAPTINTSDKIISVDTVFE